MPCCLVNSANNLSAACIIPNCLWAMAANFTFQKISPWQCHSFPHYGGKWYRYCASLKIFKSILIQEHINSRAEFYFQKAEPCRQSCERFRGQSLSKNLLSSCPSAKR